MFYKFRVEMTYDKKLNYIRHLNDLDKIWKIKIFNDGEETVRGLQIKLSFVPDFAESWIGHIDEIKAGERADINEPNLVINPEKLLSYNEKLEGNIIVELMPADGQSEAVYKEAFPLTVLPYDQWLSNDHPELLATFVTPNDRRVLEILAQASAWAFRRGLHSADMAVNRKCCVRCRSFLKSFRKNRSVTVIRRLTGIVASVYVCRDLHWRISWDAALIWLFCMRPVWKQPV